MDVYRVAHFDDLAENVPLRVVLEDQPILVTKIAGEPHAVGDVCPHNGASLSDGLIKDGCVTCPSHLWRFSLHDGTRQGRPEVAVQVYGTRLTADNWVEIEVPPPAVERSLREILLEHARQGREDPS
jgi:nitrite reductase/ring-hydroxylating ferredoxin subunit